MFPPKAFEPEKMTFLFPATLNSSSISASWSTKIWIKVMLHHDLSNLCQLWGPKWIFLYQIVVVHRGIYLSLIDFEDEQMNLVQSWDIQVISNLCQVWTSNVLISSYCKVMTWRIFARWMNKQDNSLIYPQNFSLPWPQLFNRHRIQL